jgi:hypothetical protein
MTFDINDAQTKKIALKKSRRSFLMVVAAFLLPVIIAKLALQQHWFNEGVTNQGELIEQQITLKELGIDIETSDKQWLMVYLLPENCEQVCQGALNGINNTYIALGKEMPRVTPVGLYQQALTNDQKSSLRIHDWHFSQMNKITLQQAQITKLYIVDPLGNVMLKYTIPNSKETIPSFGKAILADMKKLLKYSRIG